MQKNLYVARRPRGLPVRTGDDAFDLFMSIPPVVVLYGDGRNFHADEHNHAGRLLRRLDELGRQGVPVRGMISCGSALSLSSIRALNCYLRHMRGLGKLRRNAEFYGNHKYLWFDLCDVLALEWRI